MYDLGCMLMVNRDPSWYSMDYRVYLGSSMTERPLVGCHCTCGLINWSILLQLGRGGGYSRIMRREAVHTELLFKAGETTWCTRQRTRQLEGGVWWRSPIQLRREEEKDLADRWGRGGSERGEGSGACLAGPGYGGDAEEGERCWATGWAGRERSALGQ